MPWEILNKSRPPSPTCFMDSRSFVKPALLMFPLMACIHVFGRNSFGGFINKLSSILELSRTVVAFCDSFLPVQDTNRQIRIKEHIILNSYLRRRKSHNFSINALRLKLPPIFQLPALTSFQYYKKRCNRY